MNNTVTWTQIVYVCEQCHHVDFVCEIKKNVPAPITLNKVVDVILCLDMFCHIITDFVILGN